MRCAPGVVVAVRDDDVLDVFGFSLSCCMDLEFDQRILVQRIDENQTALVFRM